MGGANVSMKQEYFAMDYVYNPIGVGGLKSVRIVLYVDRNTDLPEISITSEGELAKEDLENILTNLWRERFSRLRISFVSDCRITLSAAGKEYDVFTSQHSQTLKISVDELRGRVSKGV